MRVGFFGVRRRGQLRARGRGATTARVAKESVTEALVNHPYRDGFYIVKVL